MQCEYCGRALKPGEWQCPGCGAPVEEKKEERKPEKENSEQSSGGSTNNQPKGAPNYNKYYEQYKQPTPPQGTPLHISAYGGFWARFIAEWIDLCICCLVLGLVDAALDMDGSLIILLYGIYHVIGDSSIMDGATLGKRAMRLKVVNSEFESLSVMQSIIRNLGKVVSWVTMCIGFVMVMFSSRKQGLHDRIANTFVIKVRR